ncbi:MAG: hypothetical protein IKJ07_04270 [Clostridia bacterium]|nr:hypothetical protein [Clostridia bacterium]
MFIFILILALVLLSVCAWFLKIPKCGNVVLVTGGVKTGKSTLSVRLAYKTWKKNVNKVKFYNALVRPFKKDKTKRSLPLIYSNVPLGVPYVPLTEDLIYRRKRFVYGSVIYCCEASLIAGSMDFKDDDLNENLALLVKLIGHETKGGSIIFDTQSVLDLHYGIKRNVSSYFYIHHKINLPFVLVLKMRELVFLDNTSNEFNEDTEKSMLTCIVPKSTWKKFDCYCYSALTDHLEEEKTVVKTKDLKARKILTFKKNKKYYEVNND